MEKQFVLTGFADEISADTAKGILDLRNGFTALCSVKNISPTSNKGAV